jgi:1,4-dihydroxy-2-naphthoate octaprenyltransferase
MKNFVLFILSFLTMAAIMISMEMSNEQPDYQAYTKPRINLEEMK